MEIKTKVTSNISFSKLYNNIDKIIGKTLNNAAKDSADLSKLNIDNETHGRELSEHSLNYRRQGKFRTGEVKTTRGGSSKRVTYPKLEDRAPTTSKKPLKYTKRLYNSIKAKKNVLTMAGYGELHDEGYDTNAYKVLARPFIGTMVGEETKDNFLKDLEKNLKK